MELFLKSRIRFAIAAILTVAGIVSLGSLYLLYEIRDQAEVQAKIDMERRINTFWELLKNKGTDFRIVDGRLLAGSYVINGNFELPDKIQQIFGGTATVFQGDTRVSTNVPKEDGSRAIGTKLVGPAYDAIFKKGTSYRGETLILGSPYFTAYDPIRNAQGEIIGVLYVGVKKSIFLSRFEVLRMSIMGTFVCVGAILSIGFWLLMRVSKRTGQTLEKSLRFLQSLIDILPFPIFYKNIDGLYIGCNTAFEEYVGMTKEELYGKGVFDVAPREMAEIYAAADKALFTGPADQKQIYEGPLKYADGKAHDVIFYKVLFFNEDGSRGGLVGSILDITERKKAEDARRASEKRFRELLENVQLITMIIDLDGTVTFCNDFLVSITGWTREEIIGSNWFELFSPPHEKCKQEDDYRDRIRTGRMITHHETQIVTREQKYRTILWNITVLHAADESVEGIAGIGIDITEQRSIEEQLRHAQKMEAIGHLSGGIAHDFNNILTVISGYGYVMKRGLAADDPLNESLDQILAAGERASNLTRSLLAFSRKQLMSPKTLNLNDILRNMETLLRRIIGEDVQLKTSFKEDPLLIHADSGQIEQVLINLATNARDAMPSGGLLAITSERHEMESDFVRSHGYGKPGPHLLLTVSDSGVGMDEETRRNIFEPFFTTKEVGKGTGLGLAIVYGIVKQHNGYINVYSEPGKGTTFRIYLPIAVSDQGGIRSVAGPLIPAVGTETLLLAEDDPAVRKLVEELLTSSGYKVLLARDGEEAVEQFNAHLGTIRLVILDVVMPKKSGAEAYEEIRRISPDVRVLFSSGYPADIIQKRGDFLKGAELILKPVKPTELLGKVREMLDR